MNLAQALMSRVSALVGLGSARAGSDLPSRPPEPARAEPSAVPRVANDVQAADDPGPVLASNLRREAWIDYDAPGEPAGERHVTIRSVHGTRDLDGCANLTAIGAWSHDEQRPRHFLIERVRALRASRLGPALRRAADIGMWLRAEAGLLHQRDIDRLKALRRREEEERDEARNRARAAAGRRAVRPVAVRIETSHDDAPATIRAEQGVLLAYDVGEDGAPSLIFVGATAEARRGRPIRLGEAGRDSTGVRLVSLSLVPGETRVADLRAWLEGQPPRVE